MSDGAQSRTPVRRFQKKTFYRLERICIIYLTVKRYVIPNLARWGTRVLRRMLTCKTGGEKEQS